MVLLWLCPVLLPAAESIAPAEVTAKASAETAVALDKFEVVSDRLSGLGLAVLQRQDIDRRAGADGDVNKLLQTMPNVQFGTNDGRITNADVVDLRPSLLSIAGGRPYDNNFQVDGLSTNSLQDSSNQNLHSPDDAIGHPQTAVINPALLESIALFASDVPVEYGGFTGGVVSARLRDPAGKFGGGLSFGHASSDWTRYLFAPELRAAVMPAQPIFRRDSLSLFVDAPLGRRTAALVSWSRNTARLENTQRFASFGLFSARTVTVSDNILAKVTRRFGDQTTLRLSSMWSPYHTENREQDLKITRNDSWINKAEFVHRASRWTFEASAALVLADNSREAPSDLYTYRYFGPTYQANWVASDQSVALRGGLGDLDSTQLDAPFTAKVTFKSSPNREISAGADYSYTEARRHRPRATSAYRHQSTVGLTPNLLVASGDGPNDLSVLTGEQALNFRLFYPAYDARAPLQAADAWVQWLERGKLLGRPWNTRAGLRYDYNDFLGRSDLAPRFTASIVPLAPLTLRAGVSRYYSRALVAYKIREQTPETISYTRTGRSEGGRLVFYAADWRASARTASTRYTGAGLATPYSDEVSLGATINVGRFGAFDVTGLQRKNRDEFSRGAAVTSVSGGITYTTYAMTNEGFTDYRSASLEWHKDWREHRVFAGATWSNTESSTVTYLDEYQEEVQAQSVYYRGRLVPRSDVTLARANYARPMYANFGWTSGWFGQRLNFTLLGRWNPAYERTQRSGTFAIGAARYDNYIDTRFGSTLSTNLNLSWIAWRGTRGTLTLEGKVSNLLDRLPNAEGTTPANPYQEGRALWAGARYSF